MGEFFKPWRRRIGLVALILACVLMVGWLRSLSTQDTFTLGFGSSTSCKLVSVSGRVIIAKVSIDGKEPIRPVFWTSPEIIEGAWAIFLPLPEEAQLSWTLPISEDLFSTGDDEMGANFISFVVKWCQFPYWFVVTPLTALSAFLLLTKPCRSNQTKIPEPTSNEGM